MNSGWQYRAASIMGVALLTAAAVVVVNSGTVQTWLGMVPVLSRLPPDPPGGAEYLIEVGLTVLAVTGALLPLYKPRPQRILDIVMSAHKRVFAAVFALATIGYFDYTYKLPRLTLVAVTPILLVLLPTWLVWLRRPETDSQRTIIVGDDFEQIARITQESNLSLLGYLCPTPTLAVSNGSYLGEGESNTSVVSDGGYEAIGIDRLGGLSRLDDILVERNIETVVLAFTKADRAEFFGALDRCYNYGVSVKVHQTDTKKILTATTTSKSKRPLIDVAIEPWDVQDRLLKRFFDIMFAGSALIVLTPVIASITIAMIVEGNGPILFSQKRTDKFGETFRVHKFRTLKPDPEGEVGTEFKDDRRTPLGDFLRTTHLDEIPQLWSIVLGHMSVVGPRPAQTELESEFEAEAPSWKRRWFVKPGLTGLAQIYDATSKDPSQKIKYDLQYIRRQSFRFDMKIVIRQFWQVFRDLI